MLIVAVPVGGNVTGDGEKDTVELVVLCGCGVAFAGGAVAGAGVTAVGAAGVAGGWAGAAAAPGPGAAGAGAPGWLSGARLAADRSRGAFSEPVLSPRMFTSLR